MHPDDNALQSSVWFTAIRVSKISSVVFTVGFKIILTGIDDDALKVFQLFSLNFLLPELMFPAHIGADFQL